MTSPTRPDYPIKGIQQHPVKDVPGSDNSKYLKFSYPSSKSGEVQLPISDNGIASGGTRSTGWSNFPIRVNRAHGTHDLSFTIRPLPITFWDRPKNKSDSKYGVILRVDVLARDVEIFRRSFIALDTHALLACGGAWAL
ncbi:hypothetical protein L3X38_022572 [Prunus dulcis]|uniref:Uncharacterized protein n=1 Tax=Prunus dulcis TaxID=3755 RepID=A0AAD4VXF0_PRUDU|nr:hypothetical protein L3X38_022572 [Prunus dulcis]